MSGGPRATTLTTKSQSDIFISSTTPLAVTIIERNDDSKNSTTPAPKRPTNNHHGFQSDIIYARPNDQYGNNNGNNNGNTDDFTNELPPRGDTSQYRASEQPDQFYHELPRSRYSNNPAPQQQNAGNAEFGRYTNEQYDMNRGPNVYTKSNGEEGDEFDNRDGFVAISPSRSNNGTGNRNQTKYANRQQERYILYETGGNSNNDQGEVAEVEQIDSQSEENERNGKYQAGNNNYQNGQYRADNGQYENQNDQYRSEFANDNNGNAQYRSDNSQEQNGQYRAENNQYQGQYREPNGQYREQNGQFNQNQGQSGQYRAESNEFAEGIDQGSDENAQYQDKNSQTPQYNRYSNSNSQNVANDGGVTARVISVTPPPANAQPTETVYRRRISVSKPITTLQLVEEPTNSTSNGFNNNNNYNNANNYRSQQNQYDNNSNRGNYNNGANGNDNNRNAANAQQVNGSGKGGSNSATGFYVSTTPSTASQRIIYIQPVPQDFAQQKAVTPANNS